MHTGSARINYNFTRVGLPGMHFFRERLAFRGHQNTRYGFTVFSLRILFCVIRREKPSFTVPHGMRQ